MFSYIKRHWPVYVILTLIAIALGFMRSNIWLTTISMFAGKLIRYILMLLALKGIINFVI